MKAPAGLFVLLLGLAIVIPATAQDQPMTSQPGLPQAGVASMRVQVFAADHSFLHSQALVRIHDPRQMHEAWDTTHDRSETIFYNLGPGTYEVEVSAAGYHTSIAHVDVYDQPVQYTVQVILKADPGAEVYKPDTDPATSAKARKESERGVIALQAGKLNEAEKHLRNALKDSPQSAQVNYLLGVALLRGKHAGEAEQFFMQAVSLNPRHVQALTALGGLRLEEQDLPTATKFLKQAITADPKQWRAHWLLANAQLMQNDSASASAEAELAVKYSEDSAPPARLVLGEALGNLGRYAEAIESLRRFLQQAPTSSDAPAVRKMIAEMESTMQSAPVVELNPTAPPVAPTPVALNASSLPVHIASSLTMMPSVWEPPDVDAIMPPVAAGVSCPATEVLSRAGSRVRELLDDIDHFSATELQAHEQLDNFGKPFSRETRKSDYVAGISQSETGSPALQEYRTVLSGPATFSDRIATRGMLSLAFVFHPAMQSDYVFDCEGLGEWKGQPTWLVHFRQLPDQKQGLQTFDINQSPYSVALKGRAWIAAVSFQIVHIEAELTNPSAELELLAEHEFADYGPVPFPGKKQVSLWLPQDTQTYLDFRGRRYRLSDHYSGFKLFSVDSGTQVKAPGSKSN